MGVHKCTISEPGVRQTHLKTFLTSLERSTALIDGGRKTARDKTGVRAKARDGAQEVLRKHSTVFISQALGGKEDEKKKEVEGERRSDERGKKSVAAREGLSV